MAKMGYWLAQITITDPAKYAEYTSANGEVFAKFGARFIVRGGRHETRAGPEHQRLVVLAFDSFEIAKACYDSVDYQRLVPIRDAGATVSLAIVEGV